MSGTPGSGSGRRVIPILSATPTASAATAHLPAQPALRVMPPLSLYLHVPWCVRKCPYCDFNSHEARGVLPEADYLAALVADLEHSLPLIWGRRIVSVFIGGGTPSLISPAGLDELLTAIRTRTLLLPDAEITLEANPGAVEADRFAGYRAAGVNRISLGIQSFNDGHLRALGRIHTADEARRAIEAAARHFDNFNLDLMYALPAQSLAEARHDLETAIGFAPPHLSAYHLTLEPNTRFHHDPPPLPDPDAAADMQDMVEATLGAAGYEHYETSAFARPGRRCRHNLNYWTFGDYLGLGAGAHGKISFADRIVRQARLRHPEAYLAGVARQQGVQSEHPVAVADLPFEFMMNALRLTEGVPLALFAERTGLLAGVLRNTLAGARRDGLLAGREDWLAPTEHGRRFLNDLLERFLPDTPPAAV